DWSAGWIYGLWRRGELKTGASIAAYIQEIDAYQIVLDRSRVWKKQVSCANRSRELSRTDRARHRPPPSEADKFAEMTDHKFGKAARDGLVDLPVAARFPDWIAGDRHDMILGCNSGLFRVACQCQRINRELRRRWQPAHPLGAHVEVD